MKCDQNHRTVVKVVRIRQFHVKMKYFFRNSPSPLLIFQNFDGKLKDLIPCLNEVCPEPQRHRNTPQDQSPI